MSGFQRENLLGMLDVPRYPSLESSPAFYLDSSLEDGRSNDVPLTILCPLTMENKENVCNIQKAEGSICFICGVKKLDLGKHIVA